MTKKIGVTQRKCVNEVVAGQEKDEDAVDHGTRTDEGTETDEADHGRDEETEADLEKGKGLQYFF